MIQTTNIHSLTDFQRNTAAHLQKLRETGLPEVLTVKGKAEVVVQAAEAYQALLAKVELYESSLAIHRGLQDAAEGRASSLEEFDQRMRKRLSSPPRKR